MLLTPKNKTLSKNYLTNLLVYKKILNKKRQNPM